MSEKSKKKCRQYSVENLKFGFIPSPNNEQRPMCLICEKTFSNEAMKPSRLFEHLNNSHSTKVKENISYFENLRYKFNNRRQIPSLINTQSQKCDDGLVCSYNISKMIAKSGKPHTIGEQLILPAIEETLRTVIHHPSPRTIINTIPLSNNSVQRRIDEMACDIEETLYKTLKNQQFSLQLDESTLPDNEAVLLAYVRFIEGGKILHELLFAKELETDTKGESIFKIVEQFFNEKEIPINNIIACATDGAPALTGRYRGFLAFLKKSAPHILTVHCVIHRQHLVAKNLNERLHKSLGIIISAVNKIKCHSLNSRLFRQLCNKNDEEFERLLLHTEVRWLSRGNCLKRFYSLFSTIIQFFRENKLSYLSDQLLACKCDIAYLTDLFNIFNDQNLQLQGSDVNLIKAKSVICAFIDKLSLFRQNIGRGVLSQFQNLNILKSEPDPDVSILEDDLLIYCEHLNSLQFDMKSRYEDLINMEIPDWLMNPFSDAYARETNCAKQEELLDLKNNFELKPLFKQSYQDFWLQPAINEKFPKLWEAIKLFFIAFPTTYMAERSFSVVTQLLSKQRNRLQITKRGDLRLILSNMEPNIKALANKHQIHPSH